MAWTTPKTWATSDPLNVTNLNTYIRDNQEYLKGQTYWETDTDSSNRSTSSTSYTAIDAGLAITYTVTASSLIVVMLNGIINAGSSDASFSIYDGTTDHLLGGAPAMASLNSAFSGIAVITGLSGSTTFTPRFKVAAGSVQLNGATQDTILTLMEFLP